MDGDSPIRVTHVVLQEFPQEGATKTGMIAPEACQILSECTGGYDVTSQENPKLSFRSRSRFKGVSLNKS